MSKTLTVFKALVTWVLVIAAVLMMIFTVVSVTTLDKSDRALFGYKAFTVLTDSMSTVNGDASKGYFSAGDLALVREVDPATLREGDIIAYRSTNADNYGKTVTHMIKSLTEDEKGNPAFITYGTATGAEDENAVTYPFVLGKYTGRIPNVGSFFQFLKTPLGYVCCILVPFLLLIGMQAFNSIRLFRAYKAEQLAEIDAQREREREALAAERAELEAERRRQEEMMQTLLEIRTAVRGDGTGSAAKKVKPSAVGKSVNTAKHSRLNKVIVHKSKKGGKT